MGRFFAEMDKRIVKLHCAEISKHKLKSCNNVNPFDSEKPTQCKIIYDTISKHSHAYETSLSHSYKLLLKKTHLYPRKQSGLLNRTGRFLCTMYTSLVFGAVVPLSAERSGFSPSMWQYCVLLCAAVRVTRRCYKHLRN